jgi:hypothetical protein
LKLHKGLGKPFCRGGSRSNAVPGKGQFTGTALAIESEKGAFIIENRFFLEAFRQHLLLGTAVIARQL